MARKFNPVTLVRGDKTVVADTAARETELRFEGYRSAPKETSDAETSESSEIPAPTGTATPKPGANKPAPKN